jgi:hypothetical protein
MDVSFKETDLAHPEQGRRHLIAAASGERFGIWNWLRPASVMFRPGLAAPTPPWSEIFGRTIISLAPI